MSPDQSKPEGSLKKQLISLGIIVVLVIGGWYLSAVVTNLIFKQNRIDSVDELDDTPWTDVDLDAIAPPNFTPPEDWSGFDPSLLDLLSGLPFLAGAFGNITDLDQFNTVAFRVYQTGTALDSDDLWRYSGYDEYQGNGWARSVEYNTDLDETYDTSPYMNQYQIQVPYGATDEIGMALPSIFPSPNINGYWISSGAIQDSTLSIDSQNGSSIAISQQDAVEGNLTYNLYGNNPTPESHYQSFSDYPVNAPQIIKDTYLQFPSPGKMQYAADNPYYQAAITNISDSIFSFYGYTPSQIPTDMRTFEIMDEVRTYLEMNYQVDTTFPFERPGDTDDVVEWFLERGTGLPMDFAAAFVMLCRWFEVPCRYAAGYNSLYSSDEFDPTWNGGSNYRDIRMMNMDAWNEVYMPMTGGYTDEFTPMLLSDVSFPPMTNGSSDPLHILINGTYDTQTLTYRGFGVNITAEIPTGDAGVPITFRDETEEVTVLETTTDPFGRASYIMDIDSNVTAGAHIFSVQASIFQRNACAVVLDDEVTVFMTSLNPTSINRASENETQVAAYIYDPENGNRVKNAILHPVVCQSGAAITGSIDAPYDAIKVDSNGMINELVRISDYVSQGTYTFRVDFNGTYSLIDPLTGDPQDFTVPLGLIDDSSNEMPFTIVDDNQRIFDLYLDSGSIVEDTTFYKTRSDSIDFDIYLRQGIVDVAGGTVEIRDLTYDDVVIATLITAPDGTASTTYSLSTDYAHWVGGVHELYGVWTNGAGRLNQSFYMVVDEPLVISITNTPGPTVDRTGGTSELQVVGNLFDSDPLVMDYSRYARVGVLFQDTSFTDYTSSLTGDIPYFVSSSGQWTRNHGVLPAIPLGNYEVYCGFGGTWELPGGYIVNDVSFTTVSTYEPITVYDPSDINIEFEIDGTPTQTTYFGSSAPSYSRFATVNLYARVWQSGANPFNTPVNFYDENTGTQIGTTQYTDINGEVTLGFGLGTSYSAGLNKISVEVGSNKNYTQIYLNDAMEVFITYDPASSGVRESDQMMITGVVRDSYLNPVRGAEVRLDVMDGVIDRTNEISTWVTPTTGRYTYTSQSDGTFSILWKMPMTFRGDYDVSVTFTGFQQDLSPECLADYTNIAQEDTSTPTTTTVIAGVDLTAQYSPHPFVMGSPVYISGQLTYDNTTAIAGADIIVRFYDSSDGLLHEWTVTTNSTGHYTYSPTLTWNNSDTIFVEYEGETSIEGVITQAAYVP